MSSVSPEQKKAAIRKVRSGVRANAVAIALGVTCETVQYWIAKDEGFSNTGDWRKARGTDLKSRAKKKNGNANGAIPTIAKPKNKKAKPLVASAFACPHCGGGIEVTR